MKLRAKCYWCSEDIKLQDDAHFVLHQNLAGLLSREPIDHESDVTAMCSSCYTKMITMFAVIGNLPTGSAQYADMESLLKSISTEKGTTAIATVAEEPNPEKENIQDWEPDGITETFGYVEAPESEAMTGSIEAVHPGWQVELAEDKVEQAGEEPTPEEPDTEEPAPIVTGTSKEELVTSDTESVKEVMRRTRKDGLSKETMEEIIVKRSKGYSAGDLAKEYSVHISTITRVIAKYKNAPYAIGSYGILTIMDGRGRHPKDTVSTTEVAEKTEVTADVQPVAETMEKTQQEQPVVREQPKVRMGRPPKQSAEETVEEEFDPASRTYEILQEGKAASPEEMSMKQRVLRMNSQNMPVHIIASRLGITSAKVEKILEAHKSELYKHLNAKFNIKCADKIYTLWKARWNPDMISSEVDLDAALITKVIKEIKRV